MSPKENARLRERDFQDWLGRHPCTTSDEARRFVAFAYGCVRDTPLDRKQTPLRLLVDLPTLQEGVRLTERWLAGEDVTGQLETMREAVREAAKEAGGAATTNRTGKPAACWSAAHLVGAAAAASTSAGEERARLAEVAVNASLAAQLARRAGEAVTFAALEYQERLAAQIWGVRDAE